MTEKRFVETISTGIITDTVTGKEYNCEYRVSDEFLGLINQLAGENEQLTEQIELMKKALRESLECEGNAYEIELMDKIFDLNYDE